MLLCNGIDFYLWFCAPKRFQSHKYIVLEHGAGKISLGMVQVVKPMKYLHIIFAD